MGVALKIYRRMVYLSSFMDCLHLEIMITGGTHDYEWNAAWNASCLHEGRFHRGVDANCALLRPKTGRFATWFSSKIFHDPWEYFHVFRMLVHSKSTYLSNYLSIFLSFFLFYSILFHSLLLSIYLSVDLSTYLPIYSIYPSTDILKCTTRWLWLT